MPGKNLILQSQQILFKKGEDSNGMFLLRKGELVVYLEKDKEEIILATVQPGGMIGEMALFDHQPRSASVKATEESEVTHITQEDFSKLIKQIPKWFTALMVTLSSRLRMTNEQVQKLTEKLETLGVQSSRVIVKFKEIHDILTEINNIWQIEGEKAPADQKGQRQFSVDKKLAISQAAKRIKIDIKQLKVVFSILGNAKIASIEEDKLVTSSKTNLSRFLNFLDAFISNGKFESVPESIEDILKELSSQSLKNAYDPFVVSLEVLEEEASKRIIGPSLDWKDHYTSMEKLSPMFKLIKSEDGMAFKLSKKPLQEFTRYYEILFKLSRKV